VATTPIAHVVFTKDYQEPDSYGSHQAQDKSSRVPKAPSTYGMVGAKGAREPKAGSSAAACCLSSSRRTFPPPLNIALKVAAPAAFTERRMLQWTAQSGGCSRPTR
jgi:hypothetical protein